MALSFPRPLPFSGARIAAIVFAPDPQLADNPEAGGAGATVGLAQPRWRAEYETTALMDPFTSEGLSWCESQQRPGASFYGADPSRRTPRAYPTGVTHLTRAGGGAFDGTSASWSLDASRTVLTINTLPAAYILSERDLVGFVWSSTKRALCQATEGGVANGSGVWIGEVWPPLPSFLPGGATINLVSPTCVMRVPPDGWAPPRITFGNRTAYRFRAREHLTP